MLQRFGLIATLSFSLLGCSSTDNHKNIIPNKIVNEETTGITRTIASELSQYRPYETSAKEFHINSSFSQQTTPIVFHDVSLYFWKPIKDNITSILSKQSWDKSSKACQGFLNPLPSLSNNTCSSAVELIQDQNNCLEIEFPEKMYRTQSLKSYNKSQLNTMKGFLAISIGPLLTLDMPNFMFPEKNYNQFKQAMWRLYYNDLIRKITILEQNLGRVSVENCFQYDDQENAGLIIQKRLSDLQQLKSKIHESVSDAKEVNRMDLINLNKVGYCPKNLGNSNLTRMDKSILSGVAGSLAWRMRGNGIWQKESSDQARLDYAGKVFEMITLFNSENSFDLSHKINSGNYSRAKKGWSDFYDIGSREGSIEADLDLMTLRGAYQVGESIDLFASSSTEAIKEAGFDKSALHIGGLQMGICYLISLQSPSLNDLKFGTDWKKPLVTFADQRISYGELCSGAALGIGLGFSLSKGPRCNAKEKSNLKKLVEFPVDLNKKLFKKIKEVFRGEPDRKKINKNDTVFKVAEKKNNLEQGPKVKVPEKKESFFKKIITKITSFFKPNAKKK